MIFFDVCFYGQIIRAATKRNRFLLIEMFDLLRGVDNVKMQGDYCRLIEMKCLQMQMQSGIANH